MFAAWEAGVWKVLAAHFQPDIVVGASAGAWTGWAIASGATPEQLAGEWLDGSLAAIRILRPRPLHQKARELVERFRPQIPFGLTVVEARSMRPRLVCAPQITWRHLAATCSIPLLFPPVLIDGRAHVDGGLMGALPLWAAPEMGARRVIALNCLHGLPFRMLRAVLPVRPPRSPLEVITITPSERLGSLHDALYWSRANMEKWIDLGERDGKRALQGRNAASSVKWWK
jgi:NTE family protein